MDTPDRLFVSLSIPAACKSILLGLQQKRRGILWTSEEQIHLTMRFLGEVESPLAVQIEDALAVIRVEPFLLPLEGVGFFPPRGPARVLWAGIGNGHTRLYQLRQKIDDALLAAGWRGELRNFAPHITLGRVQEAEHRVLERWLESHRDFEGPPFRVDGFDLMASELKPSGALHLLKRRFPLEPKGA